MTHHFPLKVDVKNLRNCTSKLEIMSSLSSVIVPIKPPGLICISLAKVMSSSGRLARVSRKPLLGLPQASKISSNWTTVWQESSPLIVWQLGWRPVSRPISTMPDIFYRITPPLTAGSSWRLLILVVIRVITHSTFLNHFFILVVVAPMQKIPGFCPSSWWSLHFYQPYDWSTSSSIPANV